MKLTWLCPEVVDELTGWHRTQLEYKRRKLVFVTLLAQQHIQAPTRSVMEVARRNLKNTTHGFFVWFVLTYP